MMCTIYYRYIHSTIIGITVIQVYRLHRMLFTPHDDLAILVV